MIGPVIDAVTGPVIDAVLGGYPVKDRLAGTIGESQTREPEMPALDDGLDRIRRRRWESVNSGITGIWVIHGVTTMCSPLPGGLPYRNHPVRRGPAKGRNHLEARFREPVDR